MKGEFVPFSPWTPDKHRDSEEMMKGEGFLRNPFL